MPKRTDANHAEIVRALRQAGVSVADTHEVGHGFPDILCGFRGETYALEIKRDKKAKLSDDELIWHKNWRGQVAVVTCVEDALVLMGVIDGKELPNADH